MHEQTHNYTHALYLVNKLECSNEVSICGLELMQWLLEFLFQLWDGVEGQLLPLLLLTLTLAQLPQ